MCYTYDTLSRVINRTAVSLDNSKTIISTESFNYDDAGNLTTDGFEYDSSNRLTMYNNVVVYYDPDGNMVSSPLGEGFFDSSNRLTSFNTTSYDYDVENIRVGKTYGETVTTYTHNANSKLSQLLVKTESGTVTKYVYGLGLIYETTETDCKVYHYDYRGSTVALTNLSGAVTDRFSYDTYGKLLTRTGTTNTPFLYNGRDGVMTDENGLVYMRARYYSPTLNRFINADVVADSITNSITLNRYAYANGNPVSNVDPFGLCSRDTKLHLYDQDGEITYPKNWLPKKKIGAGQTNTFVGTKSDEIVIEQLMGQNSEDQTLVKIPENCWPFTFPKSKNDNSSAPNWFKELTRRVEFTGNFLLQVMSIPANIISVEASAGIGFGGSISGNYNGIEVEIAAELKNMDSISLEKMQLDVKNVSGVNFGINIADFWKLMYQNQSSHSYFDNNCSCDFFRDSFKKKATCDANEVEVGTDMKKEIGVSVGAFLLLGAEVSATVDIDELEYQLMDLYNDLNTYAYYRP